MTGPTGSGKTGLVTVMVEEALRNQIPVLVIDVKGDLPNLLLQVPTFDPSALAPWVEGMSAHEDAQTVAIRMDAGASDRAHRLRHRPRRAEELRRQHARARRDARR